MYQQQLSAISLPHNVKSKVGGRVERKKTQTYENTGRGGDDTGGGGHWKIGWVVDWGEEEEEMRHNKH